jgi:hypothetical protein
MATFYKVRFTSRETGKSIVQGYRTARRAKEVVKLTYTRHAKANTDAEYLGAVQA